MAAGSPAIEGTEGLTEFDAVVGFVDLSGFTAAAERLGQFGPRGTEQLQDLINYVFTPVIDTVHRAGGEIGWFAGDAVGVLFDTAVASIPEAVDALRRAAAGVTTQPAYETDDGRIFLGVKVGIAAGPIRWRTVSHDPVVSWFGGGAVDGAADAEGFTEPGQIVVHELVAQALDGAIVERVAPDFVRLESWDFAPAPDRERGTLARLQRGDFQPNRVARLAAAGDLDFLAEHRPVSSLFLRLPTSAHDPELLKEITDIVKSHGGFGRATEGDKGATLLAVFGAPTALADRQELAVGCAIDICALVPQAQIGVTSGRVYSGPIGSPTRWDYSVLGDRVNTAARLMAAAAAGEILCDRMTADGVSDVAVFGAARELTLKGKAEPETALPVTGERPRHLLTGGSRFVGRDAEVERLNAKLSDTGLAMVTGVAGTGKSRLVGHVFDQLDELPPVIAIEATDRNAPYGVWPRLFAALIGADQATVIDVLPPEVRNDSRFPLLGPVLGRPLPDTPLTAALSAEDRPALMLEYIAEVLESAATGKPVLIEDLHWADRESLDLLARLAPRLSGSTVVATARPTDEVRELRGLSAVDELALEPLDADAMSELATHVWSRRTGLLPEASLVQDIADRANGSPLFCEQIISFAITSGVSPSALELPADSAIPDNLIDLLLAQLDALPEAAMTAASLAATFGTRFTEAELVGAFGARYVADRITGGVEILRDRGVIDGHNALRFAHSLFAETTYERLSFALRSGLHLDVVRYFEGVTDDADLEQLAAVLAHHTERTDDDDRKRRYFRLAADQAASQWANSVSVRWYEGLLALLDGHERGEIALAVGRIKTVSGDLTEAEQHLIDAVKDLDEDARTPAELGLAQVLVHQGSTGAAFDLIDTSIDRATQDERWSDVHAGMESKADFATMLGDLERAEQVESLHNDLQGRFGNEHPASAQVTALVPLLWIRGDLKAAEDRYRALYDEAVVGGDLVRASRLASDLAGLAYEAGDLERVFENLGRATTMANKAGDSRQVIIVLSNESNVRYELGDSDGAQLVGRVALQTAIAVHDLRGILLTLENIAKTCSEALAEAVVGRALVIADHLGDELKRFDLLVLLAGLWAESADQRWTGLIDVLSKNQLAPKSFLLEKARLAATADSIELLADEIGRVGPDDVPVESGVDLLALRTIAGFGVAEEARDACRAEYERFPRIELAIYLEKLGISVQRPLTPPPTVTASSVSIEMLLRELDAQPELFDWAERSQRLIQTVGGGT